MDFFWYIALATWHYDEFEEQTLPTIEISMMTEHVTTLATRNLLAIY